MSEETQGLPDQTTEAETSVVDTPTFDEPKVHPAHEKLLAELPEAWHAKVTPYLQEQDKYYQKEMEKYTPYKEFVEAGVSPDLVRGGLSLASAIESDPTEVYASLQDYLVSQGMLEHEAASVAQGVMEEETGEDFEDLFGDNVSPMVQAQLAELRAQQEAANEYIYEQELTRATEEEMYALEDEMDGLRNAYAISDAHEAAIYDLMNAALNAGRIISVADAAQQLSEMIGGFNPTGQAASEAPMVVGSAGGAGIVAPNIGIPKDDKGKKEMLARMFDQYNKANQ